MNTKEITTDKAENNEKNLSVKESKDEILRLASHPLSKIFASEDSTPEMDLEDSARHLINVGLSICADQINEVANSETLVRPDMTLSRGDIDSVCQLMEAARANMKLALEIKRDKSKAITDMIKALR